MAESTPPPEGSVAAVPEAARRRSPGFVERLGARVWDGLDGLAYLCAVLFRVLLLLPRPSTWPRTTRNVLARQVFFTGYGALPFSLLVAVLIGGGLVLQTTLWLRSVGQSVLVGPMLVALIVRGLAPILVNIIVLVRSGSAIVTELATMKVQGEVRLLEGEGIDPLSYLVLPRVVGVALSVTCLSVLVSATSLTMGYVAVVAVRPNEDVSLDFAADVLAALSPHSVGVAFALTLVPAVLTSTLCCLEGLSVGRSSTEVPQAATRGLSRSISALLVSSALLSIVSWL